VPGSLPRSLGLAAAVAVVVSNVIGSGIFTTSGFLARDLNHPQLLLFIWLLGGALSLAGALCYGELGARFPRSGGEYVFLREGFGPLPAFLTGWASFWVGFSAPVAAGALAFAEHLSFFFPSLASDQSLTPFAGGFELRPGHMVAIATIAGLALIHRRTAELGARFHVLVTGVKVFLLSLLVLGAIALGRGDLAHFQPQAPVAWDSAIPGLAVGVIFVMFSYSGWNAAAYIGEEIRDPHRNLPRSLTIGTLIVAALYLGLNAVYLYALPLEHMKGVLRIGEMATQRLFAARAAPFLNLLFLATILGSMSAMTIAGPRVYFAMARDGLFPRAVARIHPRFQTPSTAIGLQAVWASLLAVTGTFAQLVTFSGVVLLTFTAWTIAGLFVLRRRARTAPLTYRTWGYPFTPLLFLAITLWSLAYTLVYRPREAFFGLGICALGVPIFFLLRGPR
jgi:APA family basic amino acid/polyamine antiporter